MKIYHFLLGCCVAACLFSCKTIQNESITYYSIRTRHAQPTPENPIPDAAKIAVSYQVGADGKLTATVFNRTDEIMMIDQTLSFMVNMNGESTSYYDPTVRTTTVTDVNSATRGGSLNLGAVTGALGIGGVVGSLAKGINLGGSNTNTTAVTNSTYIADQPKVSIGPRGSGIMSKTFSIGTLPNQTDFSSHSYESSPYHFTVCITYSTDEGKTFQKLVSDFYINAYLRIAVREHGKMNNALCELFQKKPDAINEKIWNLLTMPTIPTMGLNLSENYSYSTGVIYDYQ